MTDSSRMTKLSDFVMAKRDALGLSERQLAALAGTSQGIVNRVCNGMHSVPLDRIEDWIAALKIQNWEEKRKFIALCHQEKIRQKRDVLSIHQGVADALAHAQYRIAKLQQTIANGLALLIEARGVDQPQKAQSCIEDAVEILDEALVNEAMQMQPIGNLHMACPWTEQPDLLCGGVSIGRDSVFPLAQDGDVALESGYHTQVFDSKNQIVWDDFLLCAGKDNLGQLVRRAIVKLLKKGLPKGWYGIRIARWANEAPVGSTFWLFDASTVTVVCEPE